MTERACGTLGDLRRRIAELAALPDDTPLVMAKDREGDDFSPLDGLEEGMYLAETTWSGERYMTEEQRQEQDHPDDYAEAPEDAVRALFLWPVN